MHGWKKAATPVAAPFTTGFTRRAGRSFFQGGAIIGYAIGNGMSSRDIGGENPLNLPQAKSYKGLTGIGPCLYLISEPLPPTKEFELAPFRGGQEAFYGNIAISQFKRKFEDLAAY